MNNLYYFPDQGFLAWNAGYRPEDSAHNIDHIIDGLNNSANKFLAITKVNREDISTFFVQKAGLYQYNRVFYTKTTTPHPDALIVDNHTLTHWFNKS